MIVSGELAAAEVAPLWVARTVGCPPGPLRPAHTGPEVGSHPHVGALALAPVGVAGQPIFPGLTRRRGRCDPSGPTRGRDTAGSRPPRNATSRPCRPPTRSEAPRRAPGGVLAPASACRTGSNPDPGAGGPWCPARPPEMANAPGVGSTRGVLRGGRPSPLRPQERSDRAACSGSYMRTPTPAPSRHSVVRHTGPHRALHRSPGVAHRLVAA